MFIESNEMRYNEHTAELIAIGNVRYNDKDMSFTASRAELNLETKTGKLYDTAILFKKENYHISGSEIEKRGEGYYFSPEATFTTCDGPLPVWCFRGKNVDAVVGEGLKARDVSFRIHDNSVLYTPYFWAPIHTERHTGLLPPVIGYSRSKGAHLDIPFFWAMSENRDLTFFMDIYSKRGIGEGLEYRYIEPGDIKGNVWLYHIRDTELNKNFFEFRAVHDQRSSEGIGGFLNINYVNEKDFYREFSFNYENRANRFLESTGEISLPLTNSRAYLLSQYWVDLKEGTDHPPQRLPEAGYVLNPTKVGDFWFSTIATVANFWRDQGISGQRLDIYPKIFHKFGSDIVVTQELALRETAYSLHNNEEIGNSPHRESIEYSIITHTRLIKKYDSFTHIIEPSLGYHFITNSEDSLPVFDSTELFKKTSKIELSLLNRFLDNSGEFMVFRVTQGFDTYNGDRPFLPLSLEVGIKKPISLRFDATYDVHMGKIESFNSETWIKISDTVISAGQRYNSQEDITFYGAGIGLHPYKFLYTEGRFWYDGREKKITDITMSLKYTSQCWGINMEFVKKPHDFSIAVMFELKGFGGTRRLFRV